MKEFGFGPCFGWSWVPSKIEDISRLVYNICVTFRSAASECPTHISYILKIGGGCSLSFLVFADVAVDGRNSAPVDKY